MNYTAGNINLSKPEVSDQIPLTITEMASNNQKVDDYVTGHINSLIAHLDSAITNTSGVSGTKVRDALITLKSQIDALVTTGSADPLVNVYSVNFVGTDTYTATYSGLTWFSDLKMLSIISETNTGSATLNINGLGAKTIKIIDANGDKQNLSGGELKKNQRCFFVYDGTDVIFITEVNTPTYGTATLDSSNLSVTKTDAYAGISQLAKFGGATAYNIIIDGDLNSLSNWLVFGGTPVLSSGKVTITGDGTTSAIYLYQAISEVNAQNKKRGFIAKNVKTTTTSPVAFRVQIDYYLGAVYVKSDFVEEILSPSQNTVYALGDNFTLDNGVDWNNYQVLIVAQYSDSATANGKTLVVDGNSGIFAIDTESNQYSSYTKAQLLNLLGKPFEGLKSVESGEVISRGVNLLPTDASEWELGSMSFSTGGKTESSTRIRLKQFVRVKPNTQYRCFNESNYAIGINEYDKNGNFTGNRMSYQNPFVFTTGNSASFILANAKYANDAIIIPQEIYNIKPMCSEGTSIIPYVPYNGGTLKVTYTDPDKFDGSMVPNLTENTTETNTNGEVNAFKKNDNQIIAIGDISIVTTGVNTNYVRILKPLDSILYNDGISTTDKMKAVFFPNFVSGTYLDDVSKIGTMFNLNTTQYGLIVSKTTVPDLATAQSLYTGVKTVYQLATQITIPQSDFPSYGIVLEGSLESSDGTSEWIFGDYNLLPSSVEIDYARNISQAVSNVSEAVINLTLLQAEQNLINLEFDARITALEP